MIGTGANVEKKAVKKKKMKIAEIHLIINALHKKDFGGIYSNLDKERIKAELKGIKYIMEKIEMTLTGEGEDPSEILDAVADFIAQVASAHKPENEAIPLKIKVVTDCNLARSGENHNSIPELIAKLEERRVNMTNLTFILDGSGSGSDLNFRQGVIDSVNANGIDAANIMPFMLLLPKVPVVRAVSAPPIDDEIEKEKQVVPHASSSQELVESKEGDNLVPPPPIAIQRYATADSVLPSLESQDDMPPRVTKKVGYHQRFLTPLSPILPSKGSTPVSSPLRRPLPPRDGSSLSRDGSSPFREEGAMPNSPFRALPPRDLDAVGRRKLSFDSFSLSELEVEAEDKSDKEKLQTNVLKSGN